MGTQSFASLSENDGDVPDAEVGVPARGPGLPAVESDGLAVRMVGCAVADPVDCCGMFPVEAVPC